MTCRHVGCFRFLETENCKKRKSPWTKVATNATSKRYKFMKALKGFPKRHVTFSNLKLNPKPSKTACCHKPFCPKGLSSTKTTSKHLHIPKTAQNCSKVHVDQWFKSYTITPFVKARYLLSSSVKPPKSAKNPIEALRNQMQLLKNQSEDKSSQNQPQHVTDTSKLA